jgi:hypothetical protein
MARSAGTGDGAQLMMKTPPRIARSGQRSFNFASIENV